MVALQWVVARFLINCPIAPTTQQLAQGHLATTCSKAHCIQYQVHNLHYTPLISHGDYFVLIPSSKSVKWMSCKLNVHEISYYE